MKLRRITNSTDPEAQKLIALHSETFPEYERFQETPLLANMIDNEQSMQFNAIYQNDSLAGFYSYFPEIRNHKIGQKYWIGSRKTCINLYF